MNETTMFKINPNEPRAALTESFTRISGFYKKGDSYQEKFALFKLLFFPNGYLDGQSVEVGQQELNISQFVHKIDAPFAVEMSSSDPENVDDVKITGKFSILTKEDMLNHDATQSQIKRIDDAEEESRLRKEAELRAAD